MKITVINGNARHGSTWHCMDLLRGELSLYGETEVSEFFLPKDMPHLCNGCFSCIYRGEQHCPHFESMRPIVQAMLGADVIILTSPVYALDVSGQMKALLDHLCYMWMSHRPNPAVFQKVGVTIVTTAGAGLGHTTKTLRDSLAFWGVKRLYSIKNAVSAMKWDDVSEKKQQRIRRQTAKTAKRIAKDVNRADKLTNPLFRSFFFWMMRSMMKKNTWNPLDRKHWEEQGWIGGASQGS